LDPTLIELEILVRQAGALLRAGSKNSRQGSPSDRPASLEISQKGTAIDLVTVMDRRVEAFLLEAIRLRHPGHHFVAEESGVHGAEGPHVWYIDPLDGTVNYAHGIPIYSVSIAYAREGRVVLGAVYDPSQDECFSAGRGAGAWLDGRPIRVNQTPTLGDSLLVTGFAYDVWTNPDNNLDHFARFALRTRGVRRLGSAALDLCYVAAGRFDGFWELRINPWDIAAGGLIAKEAGARVTRVDGGEQILRDAPSVLAANPRLHEVMLKELSVNSAK